MRRQKALVPVNSWDAFHDQLAITMRCGSSAVRLRNQMADLKWRGGSSADTVNSHFPTAVRDAGHVTQLRRSRSGSLAKMMPSQSGSGAKRGPYSRQRAIRDEYHCHVSPRTLFGDVIQDDPEGFPM